MVGASSVLSTQTTDEDVKEIAECADGSVDFRQRPQGRPFAWAESRQELCETLAYYKAYQSGCYTKSATSTSRHLRELQKDNVLRDATVYGYLLAGFGSSHDAWEHQGRVIISHGGGKSRNVNREDGDSCMQLIENQSRDDPKIASLIQSCEKQIPIVLMMASDYKLSHFQLQCAFAVLGWYWITDYWCEQEIDLSGEEGFVRFKFRFQYIEAQGQPWWLEGDGPLPTLGVSISTLNTRQKAFKKRSRSPKATWASGKKIIRLSTLKSKKIEDVCPGKEKCADCYKASRRLFRGGWMCLSSNCPSFWKPRKHSQETFDFTLHDEIIKMRKEPANFGFGGLPFSLMPPEETVLQDNEPLCGFHCSCGRLNSRQMVGYWHCASCGYTRADTRSLGHCMPSTAPALGCLDNMWINEKADINLTIRRWKEVGIEAMTFCMPERLGSGRLHLIKSIATDSSAADAIFKSFKERSRWGASPREAIPFQRHALNCHTIKGAFLSQQFTCNYGAEYKHAVKMGTIPLEEAGDCIRESLELIHRHTCKVISKENVAKYLPFNELYPVLYLESQKMNFHDDGEPGLGPIISTLSLGIKAKMMFRLKEKYTLEGSYKAQTTSSANISMQDRLLLTIPLHHGSILVQEGFQLQEMMEHAVHPQHSVGQHGKLAVRIAITARHIK